MLSRTFYFDLWRFAFSEYVRADVIGIARKAICQRSYYERKMGLMRHQNGLE